MSPVVCSIGSTHPWNAAGTGLDIAVLREHGVRPVSVIAGVTAQGPHGMTAQLPLPASLIWAQVDALEEAHIDAFRVGALLEAGAVAGVAQILARHPRIPAIVDPVFVSSDGGIFADGSAIEVYRDRLLPVSTLLTPNLEEAAVLSGLAVHDADSMIAAAEALGSRGARAVLVKGGHLAGAPVDVLWHEGTVTVYRDERIAGDMRGTGCVLAAAIAANIAKGNALAESVARARIYLRGKLAAAETVGPLHLLK